MAQYVFTMNRVGKIVPPKRQILKNISLSFFPGAKIGMLGINGSGKSTLLKIMAGIDKDFEGEAHAMPDLKIGYLPQEPLLPAEQTVREAVEEIAKALSLFAPYTSEDMWAKLGHDPGVALAGFRAADHSLLVENSVIAVVQVDGKLRDKFEVLVDITEDALRELAFESEIVKRAIGEKAIANVIVRAPKLVNIATK
jgi:ABC-type Fe3+/spermidine/putrescine transport system ATPase subunit